MFFAAGLLLVPLILGIPAIGVDLAFGPSREPSCRLSSASMLLFADTEYTCFESPKLISLALVAEDGSRELYVECGDFLVEECSPFVVKEVLPLLDRPASERLTSDQLHVELRRWFGTLPRRVQLACDDARDHRLILQALGTDDPPVNLAPTFYDLRALIDTPFFHDEAEHYHRQPGCPGHHALHDARAHRFGWLAWKASQRR